MSQIFGSVSGGGSSNIGQTFYANSTMTQNEVTGDGTKYIVQFDNVLINTLSGYDDTMGVFTAPYAGIYLFTSTVGLSEFNMDSDIAIWGFTGPGAYNATDGMVLIGPTDVESASSVIIQTITAVMSLAIGDQVSVFVTVGATEKTIDIYGVGSSSPTVRFTGTFLG